MGKSVLHRQEALQSFEQARKRARVEQIRARLAGRDSTLLPYETIREQLKQQSPMYQGISAVPLDQITGSVGRYLDFTRQFLPLYDSVRERWVRVESLAKEQGWPPVELYKIGDVYFVKDGNHRVAVARQMGIDTIEAHVWAYPQHAELGPEDELDDVLIRFGERRFEERTGLTALRPDHGIRFTTPGRYTELLAQIADLRETMEQIDGVRPSYEDAVAMWYDIIYLPALQIIHETGLLEEFPGRTEADLFVWLSLHRDRLGEQYGGYESLTQLAQTLAEKYRESSVEKISRRVRRILGSDSLPPLQEPADDEE